MGLLWEETNRFSVAASSTAIAKVATVATCRCAMIQGEVLPQEALEMLQQFLARNVPGQFTLHITPGKEQGQIRVSEVVEKKQIRLDNCQ